MTLLASILAGIIIIAQIFILSGAENAYISGRIMVWLAVREIAPLFTAILVVARSGTAITSELAQMKIGGEIEALERMGIPVSQYLVLPRVLGVALSLIFLAVYFAFGTILGGATSSLPVMSCRSNSISRGSFR